MGTQPPARHTDLDFPPYRHRPGRTPHPLTDPAGHSFGSPGPLPPSGGTVDPRRWRDCRQYLYGCDLYNHAYWWEAHEAWEGLWHAAGRTGTAALFFRGLIQAAACALVLECHRPAGAAKLLGRSGGHLRRVLARQPVYMGLALEGWLEALERYYANRLAADPPAHDPATFPYLLVG